MVTSPEAQRLTWSHQTDLTWCFGTEADTYFYFKQWSTSKTFHFALIPLHRILRENSLNNNNKKLTSLFLVTRKQFFQSHSKLVVSVGLPPKVMFAWLQIDTATENQSQNIPGRLWSSATFFFIRKSLITLTV